MIELSKEAREWLERQVRLGVKGAVHALADLDSAVAEVARLNAGTDSRPKCDTPRCTNPIPKGGEGHPQICPACLVHERSLSAANARAEALETEHSSAVSDRDLTIRDLRAYRAAQDLAVAHMRVAEDKAEAYRKEVERLRNVLSFIADSLHPSLGRTAARAALAASPQPATKPTCSTQVGAPARPCGRVATVQKGPFHYCADHGASAPVPCMCAQIRKADPSRHFRECPMRAVYPEVAKGTATNGDDDSAWTAKRWADEYIAGSNSGMRWDGFDPSRLEQYFKEAMAVARRPLPMRLAEHVSLEDDEPQPPTIGQAEQAATGILNAIASRELGSIDDKLLAARSKALEEGATWCDVMARQAKEANINPGPPWTAIIVCAEGLRLLAKKSPKLHVTGHNTFGAIVDETEAPFDGPRCTPHSVALPCPSCSPKPEAPAVEAPATIAKGEPDSRTPNP